MRSNEHNKPISIDIMITKAEIKLITSLRHKKYRDEEQLFVVEGEKMMEELVNSHFTIQKLYTTAAPQAAFAFSVEQIGETEMKKVSALKTSSSFLAVVHQPAISDAAPIPLDDLVLAIDDVQDPGNLGTIIRLADWFGIRHLVCSLHTVDCYNPKVVQASMGAIFRTKISYLDLPAFIAQVATKAPVYGTFLDGINIYETSLAPKAVLVMGNESTGISEAVARQISSRLLIPSFPRNRKGSESLNVAVSTAIACAEFRRRAIIQS